MTRAPACLGFPPAWLNKCSVKTKKLRVHFFPSNLTFVYEPRLASFPRTSFLFFFLLWESQQIAWRAQMCMSVCVCLPPDGTLTKQRRAGARHSSWQLCVHADGAAQTKHTHQSVLVAFDEVLEGRGDLFSRLCFLEISVHRAVLLLQGGQKRRRGHRSSLGTSKSFIWYIWGEGQQINVLLKLTSGTFTF